MSKKRAKKPHRPRLMLANPLEWAIAGSCLLSDHQHAQFIGPVDKAIGLLREGSADRQDWNTVANAMNVAEGLIFAGVGANLKPEILAASAALRSIAGRMIACGTSAMPKPDEMAAIDEGREVYSAQLRAATQGESSRAVERTKQLHRSGAMEDMGRLFDRMRPVAAAA